jgi:two-component system, OmpR family, response regulator
VNEILLVEDDRALREITTIHLESAGHAVTAVDNGELALAACDARRFDVVVLDLNLPGRDGVDVCRELRARYRPSPGVVMVTARGTDADMVIGLDAGADDYVVKPFTPAVLLARLASLLRRLRATSEEPAQPVRWREIVVDRSGRRAEVSGRPLTLTPTEFALLAELCDHAGEVLSRRRLLLDVFGSTNEGYARNVDCHVTRLRRKLDAAGLQPAPIHAVTGAGYRLGEP